MGVNLQDCFAVKTGLNHYNNNRSNRSLIIITLTKVNAFYHLMAYFYLNLTFLLIELFMRIGGSIYQDNCPGNWYPI